MRLLWWIFFIMGACYEALWFWSYLIGYRNGGYHGVGFNGFHPWWYGMAGLIYIIGILQLYPLAKQYDEMGKL